MSSARGGRLAAIAATIVVCLPLAACGGQATSTDDATGTSIPPLPREGAITASPTTTATPVENSDIPAAARVRVPEPRTTQDRGAKQISTLPSFPPERTPADNNYLAALSSAGINTQNIEDQLIGAAIASCTARNKGEPDVLLPAVAGQLITQQRTTLDPQRTTNALATAAQGAYCQ